MKGGPTGVLCDLDRAGLFRIEIVKGHDGSKRHFLQNRMGWLKGDDCLEGDRDPVLRGPYLQGDEGGHRLVSSASVRVWTAGDQERSSPVEEVGQTIPNGPGEHVVGDVRKDQYRKLQKVVLPELPLDLCVYPVLDRFRGDVGIIPQDQDELDGLCRRLPQK